MRKIWISLWIISVFLPSMCMAEYIATGVYEGEVCSGFVIETCKLERLDAVKRDGKFYNINKVWDRVDEYRDGRCWIRFGKGRLVFLIVHLISINMMKTENCVKLLSIRMLHSSV